MKAERTTTVTPTQGPQRSTTTARAPARHWGRVGVNVVTTLTMTPDERKQLAEDLEVAMNAVVPNWDVVRRLRRLQEKLA